MFTYIFSVLAVYISPVSALLCGDKQNDSSLVEYGPGFICCLNGTVMESLYRGMEVGCCGDAAQLYYTGLCECIDNNIKPKTQDSSVDSCLVKDDRVPKKRDKQQKSIPSLQLPVHAVKPQIQHSE